MWRRMVKSMKKYSIIGAKCKCCHKMCYCFIGCSSTSTVYSVTQKEWVWWWSHVFWKTENRANDNINWKKTLHVLLIRRLSSSLTQELQLQPHMLICSTLHVMGSVRSQTKFSMGHSKEEVSSVFIAAYSKVFTELGLFKKPHTIELENDTKPYVIITPCCIPVPLGVQVHGKIVVNGSYGGHLQCPQTDWVWCRNGCNA